MPPTVLTGLDVLAAQQFAPLRGRKIGLITNHSGRTWDEQSGIDLLHGAADLELKALFSPEHGLRGLLDEKVPDGRDERTGLPVFSLYGATQKPTPKHLQGLDTLVYDIQDAGCRFYTYISTLGACMEAAAEAGLEFAVLDRPNPLGGTETEGPTADADRLSFIAWHSIPVRHGLTVAELAQLYRKERSIRLNLKVVPCRGLRRRMRWPQTGLPFRPTSPNLRTYRQAHLYPGVGLLETTNLSVGRGTDTPFEVVGAPWMDGIALAAKLNTMRVPGVEAVPVRFTPRFREFSGQECRGINLLITDVSRFRPVALGFALAAALRTLHPETWSIDRFDRLLVNRAVFGMLKQGADWQEMERACASAAADFRARCSSIRLYA